METTSQLNALAVKKLQETQDLCGSIKRLRLKSNAV